MASRLGLRLAPATCRSSFGVPAAVRSISSFAIRQRPSSLNIHRVGLRQTALLQPFRRAYVDTTTTTQAPQVTLSPTPKPKKRFRIFRFLWRLTYLSVLAGVAWLGYSIWYLRNPAVQFDPDPSKKTLVILGLHAAAWIRALH